MNRQFTITIDGMQARLQSRTRAAQHEVAAGQVLLQVGAASLNYRALLTLQGALAGAARDGLVPLSDAAGTVPAVGQGVQGWQVGITPAPTSSRPGLRTASTLSLCRTPWEAAAPTAS